MRYFFGFLILLFLFNSLFSQGAGLSGRISDQQTGKALTGATIRLIGPNQQYGTVADSNGYYHLMEVVPGRYDLLVTFIGYLPVKVSGQLLGTGPVTARHFALEANAKLDLPDVVVRSTSIRINPLSRQVNLEEVRRLPATFYDPARLLALTPGVTQVNDQANHLSVRGNGPDRNLWRLQGLAIVNPNHTANAGTRSDFPGFGGGGVNALSAQLLDNSVFYPGGLSVDNGFATGGTFDMQLRPGNNLRRQHQIQAGFIGFDFATEGPIGKGGTTSPSYLVNYRYSFTGLLADLGVDFGGEEIRFQDISLHVHQPLKNGGALSLFGVYGLSNNDFTGLGEEEATEEKDLLNINYKNQLGIVGLTFKRPFFAGKGKLHIGSAYSTTDQDYTRELLRFPDFVDPRLSFAASHARLNTKAGIELLLAPNSKIAVGVEQLTEWAGYEYSRNRRTSDARLTSTAPYVSFRQKMGFWQFKAGTRLVRYQVNTSRPGYWEPRIALSHQKGKQQFFLSYEVVSQQVATLIFQELYNSEPVINTQFSFGYQYPIGKKALGGFTAFYQRSKNHFGIRGADDSFIPDSDFFNFDPTLFLFRNNIFTRRLGIEVDFRQPVDQANGLYFRVNGTLFTSETNGSEGSWTSNRFDQDFILQTVWGKEWKKQDKRATWGGNLAVIIAGGIRQAPINIPTSQFNTDFFDFFNYFEGLTERAASYFRPDFRIYRRLFHKKITSTLALDIQNVIGNTNDGDLYFDVVQEEVVRRAQLGIIPVISYRLEWR